MQRRPSSRRTGPEWRHELKYDGYRILAAVAGGRAKLYSRNKLDWTPRFKPIAAALGHLDVESALLDGEVVVFDDKGKSSFSALQESLSESRDDKVYVVFDILELDGQDLKRKPLSERTEILESVGQVQRARPHPPRRLSQGRCGKDLH